MTNPDDFPPRVWLPGVRVRLGGKTWARPKEESITGHDVEYLSVVEHEALVREAVAKAYENIDSFLAEQAGITIEEWGQLMAKQIRETK
jgi:hypothetical protein